jgi:hypothetical protein
MQRFNSFYLVHKGLRAMLYDAALVLQQTDFTNSTEADAALRKIEKVLFIFEHHAHHEDTFINPVVEPYEPEIAASFEDEHKENHRLANSLKNLLIIYENTFLPVEKLSSGSAIVKTFREFLVFNLEHMAKEETLLNHALWRHFTDDEIKAISQRLVASIPPDEMQVVARWMLRGISNTDAIGWLKEIKYTVPEFAFKGLLKIAQEELGKVRFEVVWEGLEEIVAA